MSMLALMPTIYQKQTLEAIFSLLLEATGNAVPEHCQAKSAAAISRFLNRYQWQTRKLIRMFRTWVLQQMLSYSAKGRRPHLQAIIDLTTLPKRGKFRGLDGLVRTYHRKRGLHLVVLYLVVDKWRIPWNYRVYRGKGHLSPADLGARLLMTLPRLLKKAFRIMVLADAAFGTIPFLKTVRRLKLHALVGVKKTRKLVDGRAIAELHKGGQQVYLVGLPFPVSIAHYYFKRDDGKRVSRYVMCTRHLKLSTLRWWGKRRWQIEGWFKTAKHRFSLHRFGQGTLLGVHRWLVLSLMSFVLALWGYWINGLSSTPDWGVAAQTALAFFFPSLVLSLLLLEIERLRPIAIQQGIDIQISRCKI